MLSRPNKPQSQQEDGQFSQILAGYFSYWPMFLISLLLTIGGAFFYTRYTLPKYQASATVLIKDEKKGVEQSKQMEDLNIISTNKTVENEAEVFQSRILMEQVVNKLRLYASISRDGKIRKQSAYLFSPVLVEVKNPRRLRKTFDTTADIPLNVDLKTRKVRLNNKFSANINEWVTTPYGDLKFIDNPNYFEPEKVTPLYLNFINPKDLVPDILSNLTVDPSSKLSSVLELTYKDEVPKRAEDVLNTLIAYYNQSTVEEKDSLVKNTLVSIDSRLNDVSGDLDSIERKMQKYKADNKSIDLSEQGKLYLQGINVTDTKTGEIAVQLSNLNELEKYMNSTDKIGVLPSGLGVSDVTLTQLMNNLSVAQLNYAKLKNTVGENNPMLLSIKEEITKLKTDILSNIQTQKRNLSAMSQGLSSNTGKYNSMLNYIPEKEKKLLEISRDQNIKSTIYAFLLQKKEETQLSLSNNIPDSKIVSYALADKKPVSPKKFIIYLAALMLGLIAPILFVTLRELLNNKLLFRKEIEALTSIPVIGEIVYNRSNTPVVIEAGKRSFIAEEFRKIRVSLLFLGIDSYHKKILVTSSIPGEGKSFIAANLAISLAMTGKKVILVDMDLHSPSLGKFFNIPLDESGVSDFLLGEKEVEDVIMKMPSHENLFFIPAGGLHPTPSELLENGQVGKLINALDNSFDIVIMDTAPVVMVTDAFHLSSIADATLYIIRHKYTPKMLVKRIDENNKVNTLKNPAIIFNGVKTRGFMKNNYGYGYDYVYGGGNQKKIKENKVKA